MFGGLPYSEQVNVDELVLSLLHLVQVLILHQIRVFQRTGPKTRKVNSLALIVPPPPLMGCGLLHCVVRHAGGRGN